MKNQGKKAKYSVQILDLDLYTNFSQKNQVSPIEIEVLY